MPVSSKVRRIGTVTDLHGRPVEVGVDHDAITVGDFVFAADSHDGARLRLLIKDATAEARAQSGTECGGACCPAAE
jgi:hypothetical protein